MNPFLFSAICLGLGCAGLSVSAQAQDSGAQALLQANGCMSCHAKLEKVVGPAFVSVADKYRGDKDAVAALAQSIQNGSKGKWGRIAMPPHASLSPEELKAMARHVLAMQP